MPRRHAELPKRDAVSRNFSIDSTDVAVGARLHRGRTSRYQLQRRFGRGVVVRRRITTKGWLAKTGGAALTAIGFATFVLGFMTNIQLAGGQPVALMLAGGQAMILGTILYCYQQLLIRSMHNEEALRFQRDIGYEAGWRDREEEFRPVVVDFAARRSAVKAGDRG